VNEVVELVASIIYPQHLHKPQLLAGCHHIAVYVLPPHDMMDT